MLNIKPNFLKQIELSTFTLGTNTPSIRHVRVFEYAEGIPRGSKTLAWLDVTKPPPGLENKSEFKVVVEVDVDMLCEDFRMVFKILVGGKNIGFNVAVEELTIKGTMQIILDMSMDVPFPHFSKATTFFTESPEVWFNVCVLGGFQIMEVPLLKTWIHTHVLEGITKALVDPARLDMSLSSAGPIRSRPSLVKEQIAQGVLTVNVKGYGKPNNDDGLEDVVYTVIRLGDCKRQCPEVYDTQNWEDICSFLVYDLANDKLLVKYKCKRLLTSVTLEQQELLLSQYPFQVKGEVDISLDLKNGGKLYLSLQYTPLPPVKLDISSKEEQQTGKDVVSGVLYVHIHGATNLLASDKNGSSDPYCVVFSERKRIVTTPYVSRSLNPKWETHAEFFVKDYTKTKLSFYVFDWDGRNVIDDDFLGCAFLDVCQETWVRNEFEDWIPQKESMFIRKALPLGHDKPTAGHTPDKTLGHVIISVIFRSVLSVAKSEKFQQFQSGLKNGLYVEDRVSPQSVSPVQIEPFDNVNTKEANTTNSRQSTAFIEKYLEGKTFVDFKIIQAKNLDAKDRNGFSDPFCELLLGKKKVFKTTVKKKTLFPIWNESVTLELPDDSNATVELIVSDKDIIYNDFLGNLQLTMGKMKEMSMNGHSEWFPLSKCKSGSIQIQCTVTSKDTVQSKEKNNHPQFHNEEINNEALKTKYTKSPAQSSFEESVRSSPSDMHLPSPGRINSLGPAYFHNEDGSSLEDNTTEDGSILSADKYYGVTGRVIQGRHLMLLDGEVYCKVRLQIHHSSNRTKLRSAGRILARSATVKAQLEPNFDLSFEVDRGAGVSAETLLIFDIKKGTKEHLATKSFSLRELIGDNDTGNVRKWLTLNNNIELEVELSHGKTDINHHKKHGIFRNFSFRKDKQH